MAIIDPKGLFTGDRLKKCSDLARLYWPYLFLSANSFGRFEVDYEHVVRAVIVGFRTPPSEDEFYGFLQEYRDAHLLFLYEVSGKVWGQWFCKGDCLPRYKKERERFPEPPKEAYEKWLSSCVTESKPLPKSHSFFRNIPKVSEDFGGFPRERSKRGVGVGLGVGVGEEKRGVGVAEAFDFEEACKELFDLCPVWYRAGITNAERYYCEKLRTSVDAPAFHADVMARTKQFWVPSADWNAPPEERRFVRDKGIDKWVYGEKWREEPEPAAGYARKPSALPLASELPGDEPPQPWNPNGGAA